jgi:hypothetical protein
MMGKSRLSRLPSSSEVPAAKCNQQEIIRPQKKYHLDVLCKVKEQNRSAVQMPPTAMLKIAICLFVPAVTEQGNITHEDKAKTRPRHEALGGHMQLPAGSLLHVNCEINGIRHHWADVVWSSRTCNIARSDLEFP